MEHTFAKHGSDSKRKTDAPIRCARSLNESARATYLSKIERGIFPPPSEETIVLIAQELHEDKDVLLAMAGKLSSDLKAIITARPKLFAQVLRQMKQMPDDAILEISREVKDGDW